MSLLKQAVRDELAKRIAEASLDPDDFKAKHRLKALKERLGPDPVNPHKITTLDVEKAIGRSRARTGMASHDWNLSELMRNERMKGLSLKRIKDGFHPTLTEGVFKKKPTSLAVSLLKKLRGK